MVKLTNEIKAYALRAIIEYGKVDASKVLPKLFQHGLEKSDIKTIMPEIQEIVKDINKLKDDEKKKLFAKFKKYIKEKEEKERGLPELKNIPKTGVVLRAAPFPSGALHLGNMITFLRNGMYAEKYKGKLILVMDDTIGSDKKPLMEESYQLIEDAFAWLGIKYDSVVYKSDRLKTYYQYAEKLIKKDSAYVCHCPQEELRKNRKEGKACGCRMLPKDIQMLRWKEMFKMKAGHGTLRIKTNIQDPNPAFRDRVLFKISDREHVRVGKKYRVWPTLEMSMAIDDHLLKITHILRGNDLMIESDMERLIWKIFNWNEPEINLSGLVQIDGAKISKSKAQEEVKSGKYIGWHDPRTWSIQSLGFRGIKPEAIREFVKEIGLTKNDVHVPIDSLYSINRKMIDADANRYSFVANPVKLEIKGAPELKSVEVPIHPDKTETREIKLNDIYISKDDYEKYKKEEIRLLHLYNVNLKNGKVTSIDDTKPRKINWTSDVVNARVFMPDGKWIKGFIDSGIQNLNPGAVIQFERFGFVRFDSMKEEKGKQIYEFWFTHN